MDWDTAIVRRRVGNIGPLSEILKLGGTRSWEKIERIHEYSLQSCFGVGKDEMLMRIAGIMKGRLATRKSRAHNTSQSRYNLVRSPFVQRRELPASLLIVAALSK
jgi:hypothetical protein